jgi:REP element-mobilizing transposase RayT
MRRSKVEIYLHLVWATWEREAWLAGDVERAVYRCVQGEARDLGCDVLALGGMPDHVHLLVKTPSTVSAAVLTKQIKGVSSRLVKDQLTPGEGFGWQEGYGVFSVSPAHVTRVKAYVRDQEHHHATNQLWQEWEETDEEAV